MAGASKAAVFFLGFCLLLVGNRGEPGLEGAEDMSPLTSELERLWSNVAALEASVAERNQLLKSEDETLAQLDKSIMEISTIVASLRAEIRSLEEKSTSDSRELVREARFQSAELKSQISKLEDHIKFKVQKKDGLETRVAEAEMKVEEFNLALQSLQKTSDEQRRRIQRIVFALKDAEKGLMNAHVEAPSKMKEKIEDHVSWLSHWFSVHIDHFQTSLACCWKNHGKSIFNTFLGKKWVPILEQRWDLAATKAVGICNSSLIILKQYFIQLQNLVDPHLLDVSRRLKLCFDPVLTGLKPHVDKIHEVLKSFSEPIFCACGKFYHQ